jgi:hypothetical protein
MTESIDDLISSFGNAVLQHDHGALDVLLAPWLRADETLTLFQSSFDAMAEDWDLPTGLWPAAFSGTTGVLDYADLRIPSDFPPGSDIPEQVTGENFVKWCSISLLPAETDEAVEFDAFCDAWFAAVRLQDGLRVGSVEVVDPD